MYDNLYCQVFADTNLGYEKIFLMIMNHVGGKKESFSYIVTDWCDMFIQKNKEYNKEQYLQDTDNFLYWKYYLDIDPVETDEETYIKGIQDLLKYLKEYCNGVVAACDFEDELKCYD